MLKNNAPIPEERAGSTAKINEEDARLATRLCNSNGVLIVGISAEMRVYELLQTERKYREVHLKKAEERAGREATPLHELKIWPSFFCAVKEGRKTYEIRKNDRGFMVGDSIRLNEYDLSHGYTGQSIDVKVTYLTEGGQWGLPDDICVMGIRLAAQPSVQREERFESHTKAVGDFLNEMYATMVDPVDDFEGTVSELCTKLLETAREQREKDHK